MRILTAGRNRSICSLLVILIFPLLAQGCDQPGQPTLEVAEAELLDSVFLAPPTRVGEPFLVCFRFEVTRAEFFPLEQSDDKADWPATDLSRTEAAKWAQNRGMRLPSEIEWRHLRSAGGTPNRLAGNANTLELGIQHPLPVGVFERGRTPLGGYDFDGNVWEWLGDDEAAGNIGLDSKQAIQIGGSFATFAASTLEATRVANEMDRASDVGFRPVANALMWLHEQIEPAWSNGSKVEREPFILALTRWRPELRRQLAARSRIEYPLAADFADFLEGKKPQ